MEKIENFICLVLTMVIAIAIMTEHAIACQPCKSKLDLEQSLNKADLVIVGNRIDYDTEEGEEVLNLLYKSFVIK